MKKTALLFSLALSGLALAAPTLTLVLNGKVSTEKAISVDGKTYVPLSSLAALGVRASSASGVVSLTSGPAPASGAAGPSATGGTGGASGAGGANQKASVSGCQNEWLFNGIWRLRVTRVEAATNPDRGNMPGYRVTAQLSNGTAKTLSPSSTGIAYNNAYNISFGDGDGFAASGGGVALLDKTNAKIPQGASTLLVLGFWPDDGRTLEQARANMPQKFLLEVRPEKLDRDLKLGFTVKDPSFRVDLTCKK